jgi:hypothetical protein
MQGAEGRPCTWKGWGKGSGKCRRQEQGKVLWITGGRGIPADEHYRLSSGTVIKQRTDTALCSAGNAAWKHQGFRKQRRVSKAVASREGVGTGVLEPEVCTLELRGGVGGGGGAGGGEAAETATGRAV